MSIVAQQSWVVYGLRRRDEYEYRYVGITTKNVRARVCEHLSASLSGRLDYPVNRWIRKNYLSLTVDVLDTVNKGEINRLLFRECFYIAALRDGGHRLLNVTDGGQGTLGRVFSEETLKRMSEAQKGRPGHSWSPESKERLSKALTGRVISDEARKRMSESAAGNPKQKWSDGRREQRRKFYAEDPRGIAVRQKSSERHLGKNNYWYGKKIENDTILKMSLGKHKKHTELHIYCLWCRLEYENQVGRKLTDDEVKNLDKFRKRSALFASHNKNHQEHKSEVCYFCLLERENNDEAA